VCVCERASKNVVSQLRIQLHDAGPLLSELLKSGADLIDNLQALMCANATSSGGALDHPMTGKTSMSSQTDTEPPLTAFQRWMVHMQVYLITLMASLTNRTRIARQRYRTEKRFKEVHSAYLTMTSCTRDSSALATAQSRWQSLLQDATWMDWERSHFDGIDARRCFISHFLRRRNLQ
jgi:hypothetical protein